jgi:hypothetical protein
MGELASKASPDSRISQNDYGLSIVGLARIVLTDPSTFQPTPLYTGLPARNEYILAQTVKCVCRSVAVDRPFPGGEDNA